MDGFCNAGSKVYLNVVTLLKRIQLIQICSELTNSSCEDRLLATSFQVMLYSVLPHSALWEKPVGWGQRGIIFVRIQPPSHPATHPVTYLLSGPKFLPQPYPNPIPIPTQPQPNPNPTSSQTRVWLYKPSLL